MLSLFCEIDNSVIRILGAKCEKFINSLQAEEGNDEIDSNEEIDGAIPAEDELDEYGLLGGTGKRTKKPISYRISCSTLMQWTQLRS